MGLCSVCVCRPPLRVGGVGVPLKCVNEKARSEIKSSCAARVRYACETTNTHWCVAATPTAPYHPHHPPTSHDTPCRPHALGRGGREEGEEGDKEDEAGPELDSSGDGILMPV